MFTLTILLILAVMVALFGCLMGLFSIIGLFFSLLTGILVGALAGYLASRFIKAGKVNPIGGMESMKDRPDKMMRYMRFMHGYGGGRKNMSKENVEFMTKYAPDTMKKGMKKCRKYMMDEFKKAMDKDDSDGCKFLELLKDLGVVDTMFPGINDTNFPKELKDLSDKKYAPLAWMLRMNDPKSLKDLEFDPEDGKKIGFLIKSLHMKDDMDGDTLVDLIKDFSASGVSGRKLKEWGGKIGKLDNDVIDAFLAHAKSPRVKLFIMDEDGKEKVNDIFSDLVDPFTGEQDDNGIHERKKTMELNNFKKCLEYMKPY